MVRSHVLILFAFMSGLLAGFAGAQDQSSPPDLAQALGLDLVSSSSVASNAQLIERSHAELVRDYLIPLGAMQKIRGVWAPRDSMRSSGEKSTYTFKMEAGFEVLEFSSALLEELKELGATSNFSCEARACGSSVQWANRVFGERILYGTEKSQQYAVLMLEQGERSYLLQVYSSARSSERQYLHLVILRAAS